MLENKKVELFQLFQLCQLFQNLTLPSKFRLTDPFEYLMINNKNRMRVRAKRVHLDMSNLRIDNEFEFILIPEKKNIYEEFKQMDIQSFRIVFK